jgi:hypothetical protein
MDQPIKTRLLRLINELMVQFDQYKYVMVRLIRIHHQIRNVLTDQEIDIEIKRFVDAYKDRIIARDFSVFDTTPFAQDAKVVWESITQDNKTILWRWIDFVCE